MYFRRQIQSLVLLRSIHNDLPADVSKIQCILQSFVTYREAADIVSIFVQLQHNERCAGDSNRRIFRIDWIFVISASDPLTSDTISLFMFRFDRTEELTRNRL